MNNSQHKPRLENVEAIIEKANQICKRKGEDVKSVLTNLTYMLKNENGQISKTLELAARISAAAPDLATEWVDSTISLFIEAIKNDKWFEKPPKAPLFLFATNIAAGTMKETQLRIISDYVLTNFIPKSSDELDVQLRIVSIFVNQHNAGKLYYPAGPIFLLTKMIAYKDTFKFSLSQKHMTYAVKSFELLSSFNAVKNIYPELVDKFPKIPQLRPVHDAAEIILKNRVIEHKSQRVFPRMIQMVDPMLERKPKDKSEVDKLRRVLKRQAKEAKKDQALLQQSLFQQQFEERIKKRQDTEKIRKEAITRQIAERTYDLNMAAAPANEGNEEEEEEEENLIEMVNDDNDEKSD